MCVVAVWVWDHTYGLAHGVNADVGTTELNSCQNVTKNKSPTIDK